jgi:HKD family nuclease
MAEYSERSILDDIRRAGTTFEFSFTATYNAFLPYYEEVVIRRLSAAGCRANALLMDASQCGSSLVSADTRPRMAGRKYTLIPVRANGAFHPKMIMLVGRQKGLLFVGSHNVTIVGFGNNRELSCRFDADASSDETVLATFGSAWEFMRTWTTSQPRELRESFNQALQQTGWLQKGVSIFQSNAEKSQLIWARPDGPSLSELVRRRLPSSVTKITLISPFFDGKLGFIRYLISEFPAAQFTVGIEPTTVEISHDAHRLVPAKANLKFVSADVLRENKGYLHAKAILFEDSSGNEVLITGSANASRQAWLEGDGERNAEIVVLTEGTRRASPARAVGLKALLKQAPLSRESWNEIKLRAKSKTADQTPRGHVPLIAIETDQGFELELLGRQIELAAEATLLNSDGDLLCAGSVVNREGYYSIDVPILSDRINATTIGLKTRNSIELVAIVHHTFEVATSAQSQQQRELKAALASLDSDAPMVEEMLKLVERVIFDDFDSYQFSISNTAGAMSRSDAKDLPQLRQDKYSAGAEESESVRRRKNSPFTSDDLALILDALNRRLGIGLEASLRMGPGIARSEEELVGSEEATDVEDILGNEDIDGPELARTCQRKSATLMRRMTAQLERAAEDEQRSIGVVRQLAAVLGILHRLRELEAVNHQKFRGEPIVRHHDEWRFFLNSVRILCSERSPVLRRAIDAYAAISGGERFPEASICVGLLLWVAWDCELDMMFLFDEENHDDLAENLRGVARLVALAPQLCTDEGARQKAKEAHELICSLYEEDKISESWLKRHLQWMERISTALEAQPKEPSSPRLPNAGDIVFPTRKSSPSPRVVLSSNGSSVKVVDFDKENEENTYGAKYVAVLKI